ERDQLGLLLAVEYERHGRRLALLAAQNRCEALFHQLPADPIDHGRAGIQRRDDLVVTPPFAVIRNVGLQQNADLQQPPCRAFALPDQRLKLSALFGAQPHNVLLYRNLLPSHDRLPRQCRRGQANQQILSNWLKRATRSHTSRSISTRDGSDRRPMRLLRLVASMSPAME